MHAKNKEAIEERVIRAAEAALADHQYVSALDVLTGMGLLAPVHVQQWRKGQIDFLERVIQGNLAKISLSMSIFRRWAADKGLKPSETQYVGRTRYGKMDLRFSKSGDPGIEKEYRTHYVSPVLSERKQQSLEARLSRAPEPVVFQIIRESACSECGAELDEGDLLYMEAAQPLCLPCAGLNELEFLPRGDAALTRRAGKYSSRTAVVVRFSRSRGRYERQGILVETAAIARAEEECAADAGERARARELSAARRAEDDRQLTARMTDAIRDLFPRCPEGEARAIASHAAVRGSGRVGRSAAGRALDARALTLAVTAAVRHRHTNYDDLLVSGLDREQARHEVSDAVESVLAKWKQ